MRKILKPILIALALPAALFLSGCSSTYSGSGSSYYSGGVYGGFGYPYYGSGRHGGYYGRPGHPNRPGHPTRPGRPSITPVPRASSRMGRPSMGGGMSRPARMSMGGGMRRR